MLPAPQDSGVGLGVLRELPIPFVCSTSVCLEGVGRLLEWGCPEEQREPPGCLRWGWEAPSLSGKEHGWRLREDGERSGVKGWRRA